jgi:GTPase
MQDSAGFGDDALLNLGDKSNDELRTLLDQLSAEENELSYRRRVLHGRIDILRAELVRRLAEGQGEPHDVISGTDLDRLIAILANDLRGTPPVKPDEIDNEE